MGQIIICVTLLIIGVLGIVCVADKNDETWVATVGVLFSTMGLTAFAFMLYIIVIVQISDKQKVTVFIQQKQYIEQNENNSIQNIALENKKIELNEKLYNMQYAVKNYPMWTFYPKSVLDLEPIK